MSEREHAWAVQAGLRSNAELLRLIRRLGTREAPRGRVLSAYRQARRAARQVEGLAGLLDVLAELRAAVVDVMRVTLDAAAAAGSSQAQTELAVYGLPNVSPGYVTTREWAAWSAVFDAQAQAVQATWMATGGDVTPIVGDEERVGILAPAPVVREGARWLGIAMLAGWALAVDGAMARARRQEDFLRQAVAAIDERTTECCLRVHGQVVPMRGDFHLTGTPRFGEFMRNPPFHWYCRTSVCLVRAEDAGDGLTGQMVEAAQRELTARDNTGMRVEIHPADARSGR